MIYIKNVGKKFENNFQESMPYWCLTVRLSDPAVAFSDRQTSRFSLKNPCDFIVFDTISQTLYCLELKSTNQKSISFEDITLEKQPTKMIHKHQIEGLVKFNKYNHVVAGFVLNFRDEQIHEQRTYFQDIDDFNNMTNDINKKSFNEKDLNNYNAVNIAGKLKRINYDWNFYEFFQNMKNES